MLRIKIKTITLKLFQLNDDPWQNENQIVKMEYTI